MTSKVSEAIRGHHRELLNTLSNHVAALVKGRPGARPQFLCTFLKEELLPHAVGEERHLYPAVDPLIKTYGKATATMSVDHEFIGTYIRQIEETTKALQASPLF